MLTYDVNSIEGPLYIGLYKLIREDIKSNKLKKNEKLPSKRTLAQNLGISTISIENAYDQLISEGYIYTIPKKGYFVSEINESTSILTKKQQNTITLPEVETYDFDFSPDKIETSSFPFSVWAKVMREVISTKENKLLETSPSQGVRELREAIRNHLESFRGMNVNPDQIIVGAGTEYLYGLLIKILGHNNSICIENPGYKKLKKIYEANGIKCSYGSMDKDGMSIEDLKKTGCQIAHVSPTHHYPTGITMSLSRRYELLAWANEKADRYIIEDDYDSEFRLNGKPIPTLQSIDATGKVIYMNTFSKSLTSTIRISYMVLPENLINIFYSKLNFFSCTVSTFEQYTLGEFIRQGYFEKHINRMRLYYGRKRRRVIEIIQKELPSSKCSIIENDSGLHFILKFNTSLKDMEIKELLKAHNIRIRSVTDYEMINTTEDKGEFILNYPNIDIEGFIKIIPILKAILQ